LAIKKQLNFISRFISCQTSQKPIVLYSFKE